jgi:hypothetical protein
MLGELHRGREYQMIYGGSKWVALTVLYQCFPHRGPAPAMVCVIVPVQYHRCSHHRHRIGSKLIEWDFDRNFYRHADPWSMYRISTTHAIGELQQASYELRKATCEPGRQDYSARELEHDLNKLCSIKREFKVGSRLSSRK